MNPTRYCPDGGKCHHQCEGAYCFRVSCCGPLSGLYENDEWPEWLRELLKEPPDERR